VATPDANTVIAVGNGGLVARRSGAGGWQIQQSGTSQNLHAVSFADPANGVVVGATGTALRTVNGGQTWSLLSTMSSASLNAVQALGATSFTIVGAAGTMLRTTDGGMTWTDRSIDAGQTLYGVHFFDAMTGWVVGGDATGSSLLLTEDGGVTWERRCCAGGSPLTGLAFHSPSRGIAVGQGARLLTNDGFETWMNLNVADVSPIQAGFTGADNITVVGFSGTSGQSYSYTADGGVNWNLPDLPPLRHATTAVAFADASVGWSAGDRGTILRTGDGGASWDWGSNIPRETIEDVYFVSADRGWFVGGPGIYRTTDGGATWEQQRPPHGGGAFLSAVWFTNSMTGFAVGGGGGMEPVSRTTDGGITWTGMTPTNEAVREIFFLDETRGWFAGTNNIYGTTDGGATWTSLPTGIAAFLDWRTVHFADASHGWVAGYEGRLLRTTDGGATWTPLMSATATKSWNDLRFTSTTAGWLVGNDGNARVVLHTADGGDSWEERQRRTGGTYNAIGMAGTGMWVAGYDGNGFADIIYSSDGGTTWTSQLDGQYPFPLTSLAVVSPQVATAVGNYGLILRTENGGAP
jgi:photosystem II stability/assembly factor-like uncharacterized protein